MNITEDRHGDVVVLRCEGRYESSDPNLLHLVRDLLAVGERRITIDYREVPFLGAAAVGMTLASANLVNASGGSLAVVSRVAPASYSPILQELPWFTSLEDALEFLAD